MGLALSKKKEWGLTPFPCVVLLELISHAVIPRGLKLVTLQPAERIDIPPIVEHLDLAACKHNLICCRPSRPTRGIEVGPDFVIIIDPLSTRVGKKCCAIFVNIDSSPSLSRADPNVLACLSRAALYGPESNQYGEHSYYHHKLLHLFLLLYR